MLSFFVDLPIFPFVVNSCHLFLPASSSFFALIFRGTFAGRVGPSLTLLGSRLAWLASAGSISAAAEIMFGFIGVGGRGGGPGVGSAFRFRDSLLATALISCAKTVSVSPPALNLTR